MTMSNGLSAGDESWATVDREAELCRDVSPRRGLWGRAGRVGATTHPRIRPAYQAKQRLRECWLWSRAYTVSGGSSEMMRNILAKRRLHAAGQVSHDHTQTYWGLVETGGSSASRPGGAVPTTTVAASPTVQLRIYAARAAAALAKQGVRAGTVVSWQLPTTLETMVVMVGADPPGRGAEPGSADLAGERTPLRDSATRTPRSSSCRGCGATSTTPRSRISRRASNEQPILSSSSTTIAPIADGLRLPAGDP